MIEQYCQNCRFIYYSNMTGQSSCCREPKTIEREENMPGCTKWEPEFCSDPKLKAQYDKFMTGINLQRKVK